MFLFLFFSFHLINIIGGPISLERHKTLFFSVDLLDVIKPVHVFFSSFLVGCPYS